MSLLTTSAGVPGVGKTMTAEALAKISKKPLMKIGAREMDYASASKTSAALDRYFKLANAFGAILLMYVSASRSFLQAKF